MTTSGESSDKKVNLDLSLLSSLRDRRSKPAFFFNELVEMAMKIDPSIAESTARSCVRRICESGLLRKVSSRVILNTARIPPAPAVSAMNLIMARSVVSLHSVLGECGFLNNPSNEMMVNMRYHRQNIFVE